MKLTVKKGDVLVLVIVILLCASSFFLIYKKENGNKIIVKVNDDEKTYSLSKDRVIEIDKKGKICNKIVISDGCVYMESADCPDQICVKHKKINKDGESIICLPNNVFIIVKSEEKSDIDN